ncbi:uncharacterized protein LOC106647280 [Copidosoma floridanum]|uniref:uncharacterized protein LOC106647280 n=1 Tax=Copidosoma floridanum TaxID=29053 RepID=UPI0006C9BC84|nr:uncharacterized protein LOC106647280 [Copidosoma floridanum]
MNDQHSSMDKLLRCQQDLHSEEEWLKTMIAKLNKQAHALQVEQFHILNEINKKSGANISDETNIKDTDLKSETVETKDLDLTVRNYQDFEEDEDDDMEE